jgi:hypothetical protein
MLILFLFSTVNYCQSNDSKLKQEKSTSKVTYAGVRSSSYGIKPFPAEGEWGNALKTMSSYYEDSMPTAVWIVGELSKENGCRLFFPSEKKYSNIIFSETDKHEPFLNYFDKVGIKVFLQVEPGNADISTLIELVLERYKHHPCGIGFGVDVEWYRESENPGWGKKASDVEAELWEKKVKSFNQDYVLFLKHWDRTWMPPQYRGDILFISDSQGHADLNAMVNEFAKYWADYFKPNTVGFQIGYRDDKKTWEKFDNPPADLGKLIVKDVEQNCGVFWVDFTLRDVKLISK